MPQPDVIPMMDIAAASSSPYPSKKKIVPYRLSFKKCKHLVMPLEKYLDSIANCVSVVDATELSMEADNLYGKDPKSANWSSFDPIDIYYDYMVDEAPCTPLDQDTRLKKIMYLLLFRVHYNLLACFGDDAKPFEVLFNPKVAHVCNYAKLKAAVIRKYCIWPVFGSAAELRNEFYRQHERVRNYGFGLPPDEPNLSLYDCKKLMSDNGDEFGVKLASLIEFLEGTHDDFYFDTVSLNFYNFRTSH